MGTAVRWLSRLALTSYILCVAIGMAAAVVGYGQEPLAFAPLLMLGLPWTMAGRWIAAESAGVGLILVSTGVLLNMTILTVVTRRAARA